MHLLTSPDRALLAATAGLILIFLELNRPGRILPGALGLMLLLLATGTLLHHPLNPWAIALLAAAAVTLALNLYHPLPIPLLVAATLALTLSFRFLLTPDSGNSPIHTATALGCGGLLGIAAAFLSRIAFRARVAKAVH